VLARPIATRPVPAAHGAVITLPATLDETRAAPSDRPFPHLSCRVGTPSRLVIPALGVSAAFEPIGLDTSRPADPDGRHPIGNPRDRTQAGWYAAGPRPGAGRGTVITDGHTYRDGSAVFQEDFAQRIGDGQLIHVETTGGSTCSYRVSQVWREVGAATDFPRIVASEHLYDVDGPERLFLATCGGSWNSVAHDYDNISLVIATPVNRG
jgi:hypothetical protein